ncbi:MAG: aldo/keto reductase [Candidatus Saccharibacteria bacterium]|nr:aldo/keto reductase [Pseudorhodobacter sp.]
MTKRALGQSGLMIEPLMLGTNVMGWTADEATSFAVLDAFVAEGFTGIDTADVYSRWVPGNDSESERIIGRWMKARGNRGRVVLATKVGSDMGQGRRDLRASWIVKAVEDSLTRLQTDVIDLYQTHWPDPATPEEETLGAYATLIAAGKVRAIGCSNYDAALLGNALSLSADKGLPRYQTVQNEFNLYSRAAYAGAVQDMVVTAGMGAIPYYGLAAGFLTGKYRSSADFGKSQRGGGMNRYLNPRGLGLLAAMDKVAARTGAALAEIAIAWIVAQPGIAAPIASATSVAQVASLARGARLVLSVEDLALLDAVGTEA